MRFGGTASSWRVGEGVAVACRSMWRWTWNPSFARLLRQPAPPSVGHRDRPALRPSPLPPRAPAEAGSLYHPASPDRAQGNPLAACRNLRGDRWWRCATGLPGMALGEGGGVLGMRTTPAHLAMLGWSVLTERCLLRVRRRPRRAGDEPYNSSCQGQAEAIATLIRRTLMRTKGANHRYFPSKRQSDTLNGNQRVCA